jgi:beta-N-acetylhexosaminidase
MSCRGLLVAALASALSGCSHEGSVTAARLAAGKSKLATPKPRIVQWRIPLPPRRKAETIAYAERHYGLHTYWIAHPHVIVEHYTGSSTAQSAFNTFAPDVPDVELHELPGVCAQFLVGDGGTIYQLTPVQFMCRHTVGLNYAAIGIEHVGTSDQQILDNPQQMRASLRLTRWLRCRFGIPIADVIGHHEGLSSPYHHERVAALRTQTHGDWRHAAGLPSQAAAAGVLAARGRAYGVASCFSPKNAATGLPLKFATST